MVLVLISWKIKIIKNSNHNNIKVLVWNLKNNKNPQNNFYSNVLKEHEKIDQSHLKQSFPIQWHYKKYLKLLKHII